MRTLILIHRYLGMAIGAVIAAWCLSGFVMMYVQYPEFTDDERVIGLDDLDLEGCCRFLAPAVLSDGNRFDALRIEMLAGRPVLRLFAYGRQSVVDLSSGTLFEEFTEAQAHRVAESFANRIGIVAAVSSLGPIERDQWTVYGAYNVHRPLFLFGADDEDGSRWYVSSASGEVVQITTASERFWNWVGAVTHWIYFTEFRKFGRAWSQTIIWLTIVASFLTAVGFYIGIKRIMRRRNGRWSPYRGAGLWHHYTGLFFGVLVLTWLISGFFSMNPWGALEGRSFAAESEAQRGRSLLAEDVRALVAGLNTAAIPADTVRLETAMAGGELSLLAWNGQGRRTRLDFETLASARPASEIYTQAASRMRPGAAVRSEGWLEADDAYYFSHHQRLRFPVYRIVYADGERFYLDGTSGELVYAADADRQAYRWLFEAFHRGDFSVFVRTRPVWDLFMLPLLLGVSLSALTGTWVGARRLLSWLRRASIAKRSG